LRFLNTEGGKVKIKAKGGHIAYVGSVSDGAANGEGELYNEENELIYKGTFGDSKYNGTGTLYYVSGQPKYTGDFVDNVYMGTGTEFRINGSKEYFGTFVNGERSGNGSLYDSGNNEYFTGEFTDGDIVYPQFLGKTPSEINEMYKGGKVVYSKDGENVISLTMIDALYINDGAEDSVEDEAPADKIYVLKDTFPYGEKNLDSTQAVIEYFGLPEYEGYTYIELPEAVGINILTERESEKTDGIDAALEHEGTYNEARTVTKYDENCRVYIYSYVIDKLEYTFFCSDINTDYFMYEIRKYN